MAILKTFLFVLVNPLAMMFIVGLLLVMIMTGRGNFWRNVGKQQLPDYDSLTDTEKEHRKLAETNNEKLKKRRKISAITLVAYMLLVFSSRTIMHQIDNVELNRSVYREYRAKDFKKLSEVYTFMNIELEDVKEVDLEQCELANFGAGKRFVAVLNCPNDKAVKIERLDETFWALSVFNEHRTPAEEMMTKELLFEVIGDNISISKKLLPYLADEVRTIKIYNLDEINTNDVSELKQRIVIGETKPENSKEIMTVIDGGPLKVFYRLD